MAWDFWLTNVLGLPRIGFGFVCLLVCFSQDAGREHSQDRQLNHPMEYSIPHWCHSWYIRGEVARASVDASSGWLQWGRIGLGEWMILSCPMLSWPSWSVLHFVLLTVYTCALELLFFLIVFFSLWGVLLNSPYYQRTWFCFFLPIFLPIPARSWGQLCEQLGVRLGR